MVEEKKEEILSPTQIGDNQIAYVLNDTLKLVYGWFDGKYYLRLVKANDCLFEWFRKDDVLLVKSIELDLVEKVHHCLPELKRVAIKTLVTSAYFNYVTKKSQLNIRHYDAKDATDANIGGKEDTSDANFNEVHFENNRLVQKHNSTNGWHNDQMYYGIMMPVSQPKTNENDDIIGTEIVPKLVWVKENGTHQIITRKYQELNNMQIKGEPTETSPRWNLHKIQQWTHSSKTSPYQTLKPTDLFDKIKEQFKKYLWFDDEQYYNILPLWIIGTYCYELFQAYPYINLWGLKNTGKTKVMQLSSILAFNSQVFINMSTAALFRIIELDNPTLFVDEAENLWRPDQKGEDDTSDIVACLNAGWMKGSTIPRVEKEDNVMKIRKFSVYCPKMLASIKGLKGALDTRCIRIIMVRPKGQPSSQLWMEQDDSELLSIRDEIYPFMLSNWNMIKAYYSGLGIELENDFGLDNRDWQIWKPLLCIAKLVSDDLVKELARWAFDECQFNKEEETMNEDSWDNKICLALFDLVRERKDDDMIKYTMSEIKEKVDNYFVEKTYFDNYQNKDVQVFRKDKPTSSFVGRFLNKVGFKQYHFRDKNRGYRLSKKIISHVLSKLHISDVSDKSDVASYMKPENMILLLQSLKDTLKTIPSFIQIKESLKDIPEEELLKTLNYMEEKKMIFQPKPDYYEVLE